MSNTPQDLKGIYPISFKNISLAKVRDIIVNNFLGTIYHALLSSTTRYQYIFLAEDTRETEEKGVWREYPVHLSDLSNSIMSALAYDDRHIYFTPNVFDLRGRSLKQAREGAGKKTRNSKDVSVVTSFFIDLDFKAEHLKDKLASIETAVFETANNEEVFYSDFRPYLKQQTINVNGKEYSLDIEGLLEYIRDMKIPEPTFVVWSGRGYHLYWVLSDPVVTIRSNPDVVERFNLHRMLWDTLISVFEPFGADKQVRDYVRVLRLPGSYNLRPILLSSPQQSEESVKEDLRLKRRVEIVYWGELVSFDSMRNVEQYVANLRDEYAPIATRRGQTIIPRLVNVLTDEDKVEVVRQLKEIMKITWYPGNRHATLLSATAVLYYLGFKPSEVLEYVVSIAKELEKENNIPLPQQRKEDELLGEVKRMVDSLPEKHKEGKLALFPTAEENVSISQNSLWAQYRKRLVKFLRDKGLFSRSIPLGRGWTSTKVKDEEGNVVERFYPVFQEVVVSTRWVRLKTVTYDLPLEAPDWSLVSDEKLSNARKFANYEDLLGFSPYSEALKMEMPNSLLKFRILPDGSKYSKPFWILYIPSLTHPKSVKTYRTLSDVFISSENAISNYIGDKLLKHVRVLSSYQSETAFLRFVSNRIFSVLLELAELYRYGYRVLALVKDEDKIRFAMPIDDSDVEQTSSLARASVDKGKGTMLQKYLSIDREIKALKPSDTKEIIKALVDILSPHAVIVAGHAFSSLLRQVVQYPVYPHLLLLGQQEVGKTRLSQIFAFIDDAYVRTEQQWNSATHGLGCGTILLDEIREVRPFLLDMLKRMGTNALFAQPYGKEQDWYVSGVSAVITSNVVPSFNFENESDRDAIVRRLIGVFLTERDRAIDIPKVTQALNYLYDHRMQLKAMMISFLTTQDANRLRELFNMVFQSYSNSGYRQLAVLEFGIRLFKAFLSYYGVKITPKIEEVFLQARQKAYEGTVELVSSITTRGSSVGIADAFYHSVMEVARKVLFGVVKGAGVSANYGTFRQYAENMLQDSRLVVWKEPGSEQIEVFFSGAIGRRIIDVMNSFGFNIPAKTSVLIDILQKEGLMDRTGNVRISEVHDYNWHSVKVGDNQIKRAKGYKVVMELLEGDSESNSDKVKASSDEKTKDKLNGFTEAVIVSRKEIYSEFLRLVYEHFVNSDFTEDELVNTVTREGYSGDVVRDLLSRALESGDIREVGVTEDGQKRYQYIGGEPL